MTYWRSQAENKYWLLVLAELCDTVHHVWAPLLSQSMDLLHTFQVPGISEHKLLAKKKKSNQTTQETTTTKPPKTQSQPLSPYKKKKSHPLTGETRNKFLEQ